METSSCRYVRVMNRSSWCLLLPVLIGCVSHNGAVPEPFPRLDRRHPVEPIIAATVARRPALRHSITSTALTYQGVPFVDGGSTPDGFDCSGFTYYVFRQHGVELPRVAADQYQAGTPVDSSAIVPGDLLFFETVAPGASHVGLALGDDEFVHAPSERGHVRVERLSSGYWEPRFLGARRIIFAGDGVQERQEENRNGSTS